MNLIGKRKIWYSISLIMIVPGVISLALFGLRLGIDFTSGEMLTAQGTVSLAAANKAATGLGFEDMQVIPAGNNNTEIRYRDPAAETLHEADHQKLKAALAS